MKFLSYSMSVEQPLLPDFLTKGGTTPRITCQSSNNGLDDFYKNLATEKGNTITVDSATVGYVSYHNYDYIATDHVEKLQLKEKEINKFLGLFLTQAITFSSKGKYDYGYKFSQTRIRKQKILLPITENEMPDWKFMEQYTKERYQKLAKEYIDHIKPQIDEFEKNVGGGVDLLNSKNWKEFELSKVFSINSTASSIDRIKLNGNIGDIPYISRTAMDNGIKEFISKQEKYNLDNRNCITIGLDTQTANYQPKDFYTSQNIQVLRNTNLNAMNAQFILPLLRNLLTIFNWGSTGATLSRLRRSKIMLPINIEGNPDWEYMQNYAMEKSQKAYREYIDYIMPQIS